MTSRNPADSGQGKPSRPCKGWSPYTEDDAASFYGRKREQTMVSEKLQVARFSVLYGPSGVGKTSLLRAGVVSSLRELSAVNFEGSGHPKWAVAVFRDWAEEKPLLAMTEELSRAVKIAMGGKAPLEQKGSACLGEVLQGWCKQINGELFIILDQFEEYFLYHGEEYFLYHGQDDGDFANEFLKAVSYPGVYANVLFSIREEALAKMYAFKNRIFHLFDNELALALLDRNEARDVVRGLTSAAGKFFQNGFEAELLEELQRKCRSQSLALENQASKQGVEPALIQLVLGRLFHEVGDRSCIERKDLTRLGGIDGIIAKVVDLAVARLSGRQRPLAAQILSKMVTPAQTKVAQKISELAEKTRVAPKDIEAILKRFSAETANSVGEATQMVREIPSPEKKPEETRYELVHDLLAPAIKEWCQSYEEEQARAHLPYQEKQVWTGSEAKGWIDHKAWELCKDRAIASLRELPVEEVVRLYVERIGSDAAQAQGLENWGQAELYFAAEVLDGRIEFSRVAPEAYTWLERRYLQDVKILKAYFNWMRAKRLWQAEQDYFDACAEFTVMLINPRRKTHRSAFKPAREYLEEHFLTGKGKLARETTNKLADKWIQDKAGRGGGNQELAIEQMTKFYENIIPAVLTSDLDRVRAVVEALGFASGVQYGSLVNCFEMALGIYFLDADVSKQALAMV